MPPDMKKICTYPGCTRLTTGGRCSEHRRQQYQDFQRDAERQRLYGTVRWQRMRKAQLERQPWCEDCLEADLYVAAKDVDHVERHEGDVEKFYSGALRSLCHACHSRKTAREVGFTSRGEGGQKSFGAGGS